MTCAEDAADIVEKALEVMNGGRGWCKCRLAVTVLGLETEPEMMDANRFCLIGAIRRASSSRAQAIEVCNQFQAYLSGRAQKDQLLGPFNDQAADFAVVKRACDDFIGFLRAVT